MRIVKRKPDVSEPKDMPTHVLALEDYDPNHSGSIYDSQQSFEAPCKSSQLSFKRGEKLRVLCDTLDWWILCESGETEQKGYVPSILFAPFCVR